MVTFSNDNKKVIYILGYGRSGSTLLESLLCSKFDVAAYGEIKYFFERGALDLEPCSCGKIVSDCGFWSRFNLNDIDLIKAKNFTDKYDSSFFYYFNRLLSKFKPKSLRFYKEIHYKTLAYLLDNSPQKVIIDSSKMPARAFWLYVKASTKLINKLTPILEEYSKKNSIRIIIQKKNIVMGKKEDDITKDILELVNQNVKNIKLD